MVLHEVFEGCSFSSADFAHVQATLSATVGRAAAAAAEALQRDRASAVSWLDRFRRAGPGGMLLVDAEANEVGRPRLTPPTAGR